MENWLPKFTFIAFASSICAAFLYGLILFIHKSIKGTWQKQKSNKVLLKELLEAFDLEIPAELQEKEAGVVKSIKSP